MTAAQSQFDSAAPAAEMLAAIQHVLTAYGFYSPLELLLATNRLRYDDYQAWRRGERATLDDVLVPSPAGVRVLLDDGASWARGLHLEAQTVPIYGTDAHAGAELTGSADGRLDDLLRTEYRRPTDRQQPDLFLDGAEMQAQNALIDALAARNRPVAVEALHRMAAIDPGHWTLAHAEALIEALAAPSPEQPEHALPYLRTLEQRWLPAAATLLHTGVRDFMSPLWQTAGRGLEAAAYDPDDPKAHASWAYLNGLDWEGVKRCALAVPEGESEPVLQVRLAQAAWRLRHYAEAVGRWFWLCWHAPAYFEECVEAAGFPDTRLKKAWEAAKDYDFDRQMATSWFPAWTVIEEPGLARTLTPCGGDSEGERAYDHVLALRRGHSDREVLDRRRALRDLHAGLLGRYLDTLDP